MQFTKLNLRFCIVRYTTEVLKLDLSLLSTIERGPYNLLKCKSSQQNWIAFWKYKTTTSAKIWNIYFFEVLPFIIFKKQHLSNGCYININCFCKILLDHANTAKQSTFKIIAQCSKPESLINVLHAYLFLNKFSFQHALIWY